MSASTHHHGHVDQESIYHDAVWHEHNSHEPANQHDHHDTFFSKYIFSMDHKMIAKQFLVSGIVWAVIGGLLSALFRIQLGYPDEHFAFLQTLLGHWAPDGKIDPQFYLALVTMHGTIMVFFVLTGGLSGTFSNFLIPLQIGARDMASPMLNMLSYWFFFLSSMVMLSSFFVASGPASAGWTVYPPLSALPEAVKGSGAGQSLWLISIAFFIISSLLGGINYITTILNLRTKGMSMARMPLTIWSFFITAILGLLSFPVLLSAALLLIFDRSIGTSFYLNEIYIGGRAILDQTGGSSILYQHLFWFLGHPEVYIVILPAMGIVSEVLSVNARKPIFGYKAMIGSLLAIGGLSFIVWAHHMFVSGMNPFVGSIFVVLTLIIAVPSAVKVFNWLATLWRGNIRFTPAMLFAIGFVSLFISGGLTGLFLGNSTIDIELTKTYFVVAHFHIVMGVAAFFGLFAGVYHWFPKMFGRHMNSTLAYVHFFVTFIGSYLIFWPMHYQGMAGLPRWYYNHNSYESFSHLGDLSKFISTVAVIVFICQVFFIINFFWSMYKGRKVTEANPWEATTLEWTTDEILPIHGNWAGDIPTVYRWPYDYSKDDREFIPQTEPAREGEHVV